MRAGPTGVSVRAATRVAVSPALPANTPGAYPAASGAQQVTGYQGDWPVKDRQVDPRLGGEQWRDRHAGVDGAAADVTVSGSGATITIPAGSGVILAP